VLPRRLAPVLPSSYSPGSLSQRKASVKRKHLGFPRHPFGHCEVFVAAAPRRTWGLVSVPISGLQLSLPVLIIGLVGLYPTNSLIRRGPIHRRRTFGQESLPASLIYKGLASVSRGYPLPMGRLSTCYGAVCRCIARLACFSRTPIAVASGRIDRSYAKGNICARL
jgi:hypothetical protein